MEPYKITFKTPETLQDRAARVSGEGSIFEGTRRVADSLPRGQAVMSPANQFEALSVDPQDANRLTVLEIYRRALASESEK